MICQAMKKMNILKNLTEQEQQDLSDLLDKFTIWYDNYFDEDEEILEEYAREFTNLYGLIKDLETKALNE